MVARAAHEALSLVFPTQEKLDGLRKAFQKPILEYARHAALYETVKSLSDERTVGPDDAQATQARVASTAIAAIDSLLGTMPAEEVSKQIHLYEFLFGNSEFWAYAFHHDASVRRSLHRLVCTCLQRYPYLIESNLPVASHAYVYKGLASDQTSSAVDYIWALGALTATFPTIWTDAYSENKSAVSRLRHFLKHGSRSGPPSFWELTARLLRKIPVEAWPQSYEEMVDILSAAKAGITSRDERFNSSASWPAYFVLVDILSSLLPGGDAETLLDAFALPPICEYLNPSEETESWKIPAAKTASLVSKAALIVRIYPLLERKWPQFASKLVETAKLSHPEQSKEYDTSQRHVATSGERWANLQRELFTKEYQLPNSVNAAFFTSNVHILNESIKLLTSREGKPYGAAAVIGELLRACGTHLMQDGNFKVALTNFVTNEVPRLLYSPSQKYLGLCIYAISSEPEFDKAFRNILESLLSSGEPVTAKLRVLQSVFPMNASSNAIETAQNYGPLQTFFATKSIGSIGFEERSAFSHLFKLGVISQQEIDSLLLQFFDSLSISDHQTAEKLEIFEDLAQSNSKAVHSFMANSEGSGEHFLAILLGLQQSSDEKVASKAAKLSSLLTSNMGDAAADAKYHIIRKSLGSVSESSMPIDSVLGLASEILDQGDGHAAMMLSPENDWVQSILAISTPPRLSQGLLSLMGGLVHFVQSGPKNSDTIIPYDQDGFSQALRVSVFTADLLKRDDPWEQLGKQRTRLIALIAICAAIAEDNVSIAGANHLWEQKANLTAESGVLEFIADTNALVNRLIQGPPPVPTGENVENSITLFMEMDSIQQQYANTPLAYYAALASAKARSNYFELVGYGAVDINNAETQLKEQLRIKDLPRLLSCIVGYAQPLSNTQTLKRSCNELIADLTEHGLESNHQRGLELLVLFNAILHTQEQVIDAVAKPRLIFLLKHLISWLGPEAALAIKAEVCKACALILPSIRDMYGQHWSDVVANVENLWQLEDLTKHDTAASEQIILVTNASLRLYTVLRKLSEADDTNEDLSEAMKDGKSQMYDGQIGLLKSLSGAPDDKHQPRLITNELLARQISVIPGAAIGDAEELYPLLYSPSRAIQDAAFGLLHKHIPLAQEQISLDAALDGKKVTLPDEVLSLVIDTPSMESLDNDLFDKIMPRDLQGYLCGWRLIFDHFSGSSYRVQNDYSEQLKEGAYINGLLSLAFDFLGHTRGRPVNASKFDVQEYIHNRESEPEKDVQMLLTHLYYLALKNLQGLVKSYFLDIRSRQTSQAVESWTAKYISPLIISSILRGVADWAEKSVKDEPEFENMTVKVSMQSREINVSYLVDEQTMAIKVVLPETYPLGSAQVLSVSRVAVKDEKWQSWLRSCQGVIIFSVSCLLCAKLKTIS